MTWTEPQRAVKPTDEQQAILDRPPTETIKVMAEAGCGKTSTLEAYERRWTGRGLYLANNSSVATEAAHRLPANVEVRRAHSYANREPEVGKVQNRLVKCLILEHIGSVVKSETSPACRSCGVSPVAPFTP